MTREYDRIVRGLSSGLRVTRKPYSCLLARMLNNTYVAVWSVCGPHTYPSPSLHSIHPTDSFNRSYRSSPS